MLLRPGFEHSTEAVAIVIDRAGIIRTIFRYKRPDGCRLLWDVREHVINVLFILAVILAHYLERRHVPVWLSSCEDEGIPDIGGFKTYQVTVVHLTDKFVKALPVVVLRAERAVQSVKRGHGLSFFVKPFLLFYTAIADIINIDIIERAGIEIRSAEKYFLAIAVSFCCYVCAQIIQT